MQSKYSIQRIGDLSPHKKLILKNPPPAGHYSFVYTPTFAGSTWTTAFAFNTNSSSTNTFIIDNITMCPINAGPQVLSYNADMLMHTDYYPFGQQMPARTWQGTSEGYRYSHNSHEKEDAIYKGAQSAEYWMYDSRIGRRWEMDPVPYEWQSTYAAFNNNPIYFADPLGLEGKDKGKNKDKGGEDAVKGKQKGTWTKDSNGKYHYKEPPSEKKGGESTSGGATVGGKAPNNGSPGDGTGKPNPGNRPPGGGPKPGPGNPTYQPKTTPVWGPVAVAAAGAALFYGISKGFEWWATNADLSTNEYDMYGTPKEDTKSRYKPKDPPTHKLYTLRAKEDGVYPVFEWGQTLPAKYTYLKEGEIWKIGETAIGNKRYSQIELDTWGVRMQDEDTGTRNVIKGKERQAIFIYQIMFGKLPPGNKMLR